MGNWVDTLNLDSHKLIGVDQHLAAQVQALWAIIDENQILREVLEAAAGLMPPPNWYLGAGCIMDIVGAWLKQKDLTVTEYYSQPTQTMIAEAHDTLLTRMAAQIDVDGAVLRSPAEIQRLVEEAKGRAGTQADVVGGQCVSHGYCAAKFACTGCAGKVPDPAKRHQVVAQRRWALMQVDFALQEGLLPEAERMKRLIRDCDVELAEMDQIEAYREDEQRGVQIEHRQK